MREIGGYFEMEKANGSLYHEGALALNSGRHCLEYIIRERHIKKLYIPEFMCYTATETCKKCQCEYEYYPIQKNFLPDLKDKIEREQYIYIVNYYGQISNKVLDELVNEYRNVIIDNVQAYFQKPLNGVDTIYSCRKFLGIADGGFLYTTIKSNMKLEKDFSSDRIHFVLGRFEQGATIFFEEASRNNDFFSDEPVKLMSALTENMLKSFDYQEIMQKRENNFETLNRYLGEINELNVVNPIGPFMYPLCIKNGAELRKKLIQKKIYIPYLWGDVFRMAKRDSVAWYYAENILPLPCDQRYGEVEMKYIVENVKKR